jgi:hypothetical protein
MQQPGRLAHFGHLYYVTNPPRHQVTPFSMDQVLQFDRSAMLCPDSFTIRGRRVVQLLLQDPDPRRVHIVGLFLAEAYLTYTTTDVFPVGKFPDLTEYQHHSSGQEHMFLIQDCSRSLILCIVRALYSPYTDNLGPPCPFELAPSIHARLLSYEHWRVIHLGEVLPNTNIRLDSYRVYEWFMGCPFIGQVPMPLYCYFAGFAQMARL